MEEAAKIGPDIGTSSLRPPWPQSREFRTTHKVLKGLRSPTRLPVTGVDAGEPDNGRSGGRGDGSAIGAHQLLAVTGEWRGWRLGMLRSQYDVDDLLVRTAFEPGGRALDVRSRMDIVGASVDLLEALVPVDDAYWTVGANYRRYSDHFGSTALHANTLDLGSMVGVVFPLDHEHLEYVELAAGVAGQNVTAARVDLERRSVEAPRPLRYGASAGLGMQLGDASWQRLEVLLAAGHTDDRGALDEDHDHFGVELALAGRLFLRAGEDDEAPGGETSYGVGIWLDEPWLGPLAVRADYTRTEVEEDLGRGPRDMIFATVRLRR